MSKAPAFLYTTLGFYLRAHRESRGLTLRDVSNLTKVSIPLLEGLERDDISRWPGGIFRRAFVRGYAEAVGLDPDFVFREFEFQRLTKTAVVDSGQAHRPVSGEPQFAKRDSRTARLQRAYDILDAWSVILPHRVVTEEIGDYLEDITRRIALGQRWRPRLRIAAAIFWTGINAIGYTVKDMIGRRKAK